MAAGRERETAERVVQDWPWGRLTGVAGIVFVVLAVAALIIASNEIARDDPAQDDPLDTVRRTASTTAPRCSPPTSIV
jgi:hypothetical protein